MERSAGPDSAPLSPVSGAPATEVVADDLSGQLSGQADSFGLEQQQIVDLAVGSDLGGVTIVRMLAEGGMGRVYEGRQQAPARPVAVKVLRDGLASRAVMKRFEQEAHLLARLRHPHIAQVHTLGTCQHGSVSVPFFVMELVEHALPIDRFAREHRLSARQRVTLLRRVAAAVAYGHRLGIVHRDLKPGNILVGGDGEPKVIDFGVARSTDADLALTTLQTDAGQLVGTLRYMSPEQFDADASRINAPTDVYALGLVLHELLTGDLPYDVRGKPIVVAARIIREQEPPSVAALCRGLRAEFGGDAPDARRLAAITVKCLQKRPADRYASADELEAELARWLAGEPVHARPATLAEQAWRFARRHRLPVVAAVLVCAAGLAAAFFVSRARHQEQLAQRHRAGEQEEAYYSTVQRSAAAADRRNIPIAASLLERARSLQQASQAVSGLPIELDCLAARLDDAVAELPCDAAIVRAVAASSAGDRLVAGDDRGVVRVWTADDAGGYQESHVLGGQLPSGQRAAIWSAAVSGDGRRAVTAAENGVATVWDVMEGKPIGSLRGHSAALYGCSLAPDGRTIATASADGTVGLWDAETGVRSAVLTPQWRPAARDRNVYGVAFAGEGERIAAACGDGVIRLWSRTTGELQSELRGHSRRVFAVRFAADSTRLASASEDGTARVWDVANGRCVAVLRHPLRVNDVAWTEDGDGLATVSADAILRVWNPGDGRLARELVGHRDAVWSVARLSGGRFATASADATARVWDIGGRTEPVMLCGSEDGVGARGVACSPDGRLAATATAQGQVRLWNMATCTAERDLPTVRGRVNAVDFSPAGDVVAAACGDGSARLYRVDNAAELERLAAHEGPVFAVAFSPDGRRIATAGALPQAAGPEKGAVRVRSLSAGDGGVLTLPHPARAHAAAWSPDGLRLATACADGLVREWDTVTGRMLGAFKGHADDVNWVAWSRDGSRVASASSDGTVRLWKPADGWSSIELKGPVGQVWEVAISPDGTRIAGVGADASLHLWHTESGRHLLALDGHEGPLWGVAFSFDGRSILTGSDDGTARVWGLSPAELHRQRLGVRP
jgi:eukaryotic-like serine/threonine-protein kinase